MSMILRCCVGALLLLLVEGLREEGWISAEGSKGKDVRAVIHEMQETINLLQHDMKTVKTELGSVKDEREKMKTKISAQSQEMFFNRQRVYQLEKLVRTYTGLCKIKQREDLNEEFVENGNWNNHIAPQQTRESRQGKDDKMNAGIKYGSHFQPTSDVITEESLEGTLKPAKKDIDLTDVEMTNDQEAFVAANESRKSNTGKSSNKDIQTVIKELSDDVHSIHTKIHLIENDQKDAAKERRDMSSHIRTAESTIKQNQGVMETIKRKMLSFEEGYTTSELRLIRCPRYIGFCLKKDGTDQNDGQLSLPRTKTMLQCLSQCASYKGSTGCEVAENPGSDFGCSVHTKEVWSGNGYRRDSCWVFSKCPDAGDIGSPTLINV